MPLFLHIYKNFQRGDETQRAAAKILVDRTKTNGGRDNITAIVV